MKVGALCIKKKACILTHLPIPSTSDFGHLHIDAYVSAAGKLFHIKGITYIADIITELNDFEVKQEGDAIMLAKCDDLDINTLITDVELKQALLKMK